MLLYKINGYIYLKHYMLIDSTTLNFGKDMVQDIDPNLTNYLLFFGVPLLMVQYFLKLQNQ